MAEIEKLIAMDGEIDEAAESQTAQVNLNLIIIQYMCAVLYVGSAIIFGLFPSILQISDGKQVVAHRALMTVVGWIAIPYLFANMTKNLQLIYVSMGWRVAYLPFVVIYCVISGDQEPIALALVVGLDIGLPLVACIVVPGRDWVKSLKALGSVVFMPPCKEGGARLLDWFSWITAWMGFALALASTVDSAAGIGILMAKDSHSNFTFALYVTGLYCFVLMFAAHDGSDGAHYLALGMGGCLQIAAGLWYLAGVPTYMCANLFLWVFLISAIHGYTVVWQKLVSPPTGEGNARVSPAMWLMGSGGVLAALSAIWYSLSFTYSDSCSLLANNIHGQDLLVAVFAAVLGIAVLDFTDQGVNSSYVVSWLLPMSAVYFTSWTKLLCHLQVGSPFHPSWHARRLAPVWGGADVINATFWIATLLLTAIGTSYSAIVVLRYTKREGWSWLQWHGALIIFATGWFMAMFVSGLPPPLKWMAELPPPIGWIPPFLPSVDKIAAVAQHKKDLYMGCFLLMAGPLAKKFLPGDTSRFAPVLIATSWFLFILGKIRLALGQSLTVVTPDWELQKLPYNQ